MEMDRRLEPTRRPGRSAVGYQQWRDLLFIHWRIPTRLIRHLVPKDLEIDTYQGDAWLGLVPFYMSKVRPWWSPSVPWISNFCETNLRTYVHAKGEKPGVWFFSLDAARLLPVLIARGLWNLNYYWARMERHRQANQVQYASQRFSTKVPAKINLSASIGKTLPTKQSKMYPTSLEFFLVERYLLYTDSPQGLVRGQVHHSPYPLRQGNVLSLEQNLSDAIGCALPRAPDHVLFSEGVDVEIYPLEAVDLNSPIQP